jgi:hypothetical protein
MSNNIHLTNFQAKKYEVDLVVDTAAYTAGDVLSDRVAVALVSKLAGARPVRGEITGITLLDKDDEGVALDLVVLDADVTIGTINGAPSISDANAEKIVAVVPVATTDYDDVGGSKVARPSFDPIPFESADGNLYIGAINGAGTPTFTAATDLRLKLMVRLDNYSV